MSRNRIFNRSYRLQKSGLLLCALLVSVCALQALVRSPAPGIGIGVSSAAFGETQPTGSKLLVNRSGGGNKVFYVSLDRSGDTADFQLVEYDFRKDSSSFSTPVDSLGSAGPLLRDVLSGKTAITGQPVKPKGLTGTWLHLYVVTSNDSTQEIQDTSIIHRLQVLETRVNVFMKGRERPSTR